MSPLVRHIELAGLHRELGAKFGPFAGYDMPIQYPAGLKAEHLHTRSQAGLFDVSHMGQLRIRSRDGHLHYVSNSDLTNLTLENLSMGTGYIAVTIGFEMSAEVEAMDVLPAIQTSAAAALASDPSVDPDHPIGVHIEGLEGSTLKCVVLLRYLAEKDTYRLRTATLEAVRETLVRMDALDSSEVAVVRRAAHPA